MGILLPLLKAKGFKINVSNTFTKVTTRTGDAETCDEGLADFINKCREDLHFADYKLIPLGVDAFVVAVDYNYEDSIAAVSKYADAVITGHIAEYFRNCHIESGSFSTVVEDGKLCYQYKAYESLMGAYMRRTDPVPKVEEKIIEYALKVLPDVVKPQT